MLLVCSVADVCQQSEQDDCLPSNFWTVCFGNPALSSPKPCLGQVLTAWQLLTGQQDCSSHVRPARLAESCRSGSQRVPQNCSY